MPDLSLETVHAFWHEYDARILYRIVTTIEKAEQWIESSPELESIIQDLGDVLDSTPEPPDLSEETYIQLLTSIPFSQGLRIMQFLETKKSGFVSGLLMWAEDQKKAKKSNQQIENFLRRNLVFERLQLLARIFSKDRIDLLNKAKDSIHD